MSRNGHINLVIAVIVGATLFVACGGRSVTQQAQDRLDEGLQAQIAGDPGTADARYTECLRLEPGNVACLFNRGLIAQNDGRIDEAVGQYRSALATDPTYGPALFNLALLVTPSDPQEAVGLYRRYVEAVPDDAGGHLNLGLLLRSLGDATGAEERFARVRALDPTRTIPDPPAS